MGSDGGGMKFRKPLRPNTRNARPNTIRAAWFAMRIVVLLMRRRSSWPPIDTGLHFSDIPSKSKRLDTCGEHDAGVGEHPQFSGGAPSRYSLSKESPMRNLVLILVALFAFSTSSWARSHPKRGKAHTSRKHKEAKRGKQHAKAMP